MVAQCGDEFLHGREFAPHGYWSYDWANTYERVASLDVAQRLLKTAAPHGLYGFRKNQRFYFPNVLEEPDQPGEWFEEDSPAWALGFKRIPVEQIGLREDKLRRALGRLSTASTPRK